MIATAWSEPGSANKPNEDWYGIVTPWDCGGGVVLDGGTARTDTGCKHGVSWYSSQLGSALHRMLEDGSREPLTEILATGIRLVADLHVDVCDLTHPGTPSAAVGMVRPTGPLAWEYAVLGDVTVVLGTSSGPVVLVDRRISGSAAAERAEADRWPIGSPEKETSMIAMKHAELAERNRSYWIAATDPSAAQHALTGSIDGVDRLAVLTDGAARACLFGLMDWSKLLRMMAAEGPARVIQHVRNAETSDREGRRWPRNKQSDDATAVYVGPVGN